MPDNVSDEPQKSALVINSRPYILNIISNQLALFGWQTEAAATISQALELILRDKWQLIFFSHTLQGAPCSRVEHQLEHFQADAHFFLIKDDVQGEPSPLSVRDIFCEIDLSGGNEQAGIGMLHRWLPVVEERIFELRDAVTLPTDLSSDSPIIGACPAMREARRQVALLAETREPCLITGEEGTGKLLVARTLHEMRYTDGEQLTLIMCEEENERLGAGGHPLLLDIAQSNQCGTILLSQLEAASDELQTILLNPDYEMGAHQSIVASSCRDLHAMVMSGTFRAELYDRLKHYIYLPPLRERREDIGLLLSHFVRQFVNRPYVRVSQRAWKLLHEHDWEFNLPELHSVALNAVASGAGMICVMDITFSTEEYQS